MKDLYETIPYKGYTINIYQDPEPQNPRTEWDNLGKMICFHNRYNLGDKHNYQSLKECLDVIKNDALIILPLYLYDHSRLTINTTGFSCPWDSGQVGYIYVEKKVIKKEYSWTHIPKKRKAQITQYLQNEVKIYDQYLTGQVFGYVVKEPERVCPTCHNVKAGEIDSCWGFYGTDFKENGLLENAYSAIG